MKPEEFRRWALRQGVRSGAGKTGGRHGASLHRAFRRNIAIAFTSGQPGGTQSVHAAQQAPINQQGEGR